LAHKQHNVTRRTEPLIADDRCYEGLLEREDNLLPPQLEVDAEPPTGLEVLYVAVWRMARIERGPGARLSRSAKNSCVSV
jgi:hypothetical protein